MSERLRTLSLHLCVDSYVLVILKCCSLFLEYTMLTYFHAFLLALPTFIFIFSLSQACSVTKFEGQTFCDLYGL